jgi:hypothetical protein
MATYQPFPEISAAFNQLPPSRPTRIRGTGLLVPFLYATLGLGFGTVAGTALGVATMQGGPLTASQLIPASTPADGYTIRPIANVIQSPPVEPQIAPQTAKLEISTTPKPAHPILRFASKHNYVSALSAASEPSEEQSPDDSATATNSTPVSTEEVKLDVAAPSPFAFSSEGDATVSDYDASTGRIETYEGRTFVINASAGTGGSTSWQDYQGNLHYRCDQNGSCTLARSGVVVPNAKLLI